MGSAQTALGQDVSDGANLGIGSNFSPRCRRGDTRHLAGEQHAAMRGHTGSEEEQRGRKAHDQRTRHAERVKRRRKNLSQRAHGPPRCHVDTRSGNPTSD